MNQEKTFFINSAIDFSESGTYSLVDNTLSNKATLVISDEKAKVYFESGAPEMDFGTDYEYCIQFIKDNALTVVKLMSGDKRWKEYNPNPKERNIGDCTLRSYCAAFNISWDKAFDIASRVAKENSSMIQYVADKVLTEEFNCVVDEKYNKKTVKGKDRITVNEFAMSHPYGTYILHVRQHQVTVIDGVYWDSWDSGDKKVDTVYIPPKNN
jgi:hypothetical protein